MKLSHNRKKNNKVLNKHENIISNHLNQMESDGTYHVFYCKCLENVNVNVLSTNTIKINVENGKYLGVW